MEKIDSPEVCIGIPTLNGPERLFRCLGSIVKHTDLLAHRAVVIVSDDFSYEKHLEENKKICANFGVDLLFAPARIGVAQQWNRLTLHTKAPIMILMNDDVEVVDDWLDALVFSIRNNPHAGMVGLKAYQGVTSDNFTPPPVHSYNEAVMEHGVGMIASTGFLFGFERKKYDAVDGFDPNFFAFYEEVDFGVKLYALGHPSYMLSYPVIIHQGGATTSDSRNIDAKKIIRESREKFKAKHGSIRTVRENMVAPRMGWPRPVQWNTMLKTWVD
jgi:GT2 family glycosyltransferase